MDYSDVFPDLERKFAEHGIPVFRDFRVKTIHGTDYEVDFYVPAPVRAAIDIRSTRSPFSERAIGRLHGSAYTIRRDTGALVVPIVLFWGEELPPEIAVQDIPNVLIYRAKDTAELSSVVKSIVGELLSRAARPDLLGGLTAGTLMADLAGVRELAPLLASYGTLVAPEYFVILRDEINEFLEEYRSGHFTTAALRVGRTLEHIVYTLARDWDVPINRMTLETLAGFEAVARSLSQSWLNLVYARSDEEKILERKSIDKKTAELQKLLAVSVERLQETPVVKPGDAPLNLNAIITDIRRRYRSVDGVDGALKKLEKSKAVWKLQNERNRAAHASILVESKTFTKSDIEVMIGHLATILYHLVTVGDLVARSRGLAG